MGDSPVSSLNPVEMHWEQMWSFMDVLSKARFGQPFFHFRMELSPARTHPFRNNDRELKRVFK